MKLRQLNAFVVFDALALSVFLVTQVRAQSPEVQARLAEVKESIARNRQALSHYTWTQQDVISLKGEERKEELFQVRIGPDGKPQRSPLDPAMSDEERHRHGLRGRIVEKKTEEYKEYADEMKSLMQQYIPPESTLLDAAYQHGNVMAGPAGAPNEVRLVITQYVKPQDSVTLIFEKQTKKLLSMQISSYLKDPGDAVKMNAAFNDLPDGTHHISNLVLDGVKRELTITITNTNYQKL